MFELNESNCKGCVCSAQTDPWTRLNVKLLVSHWQDLRLHLPTASHQPAINSSFFVSWHFVPTWRCFSRLGSYFVASLQNLQLHHCTLKTHQADQCWCFVLVCLFCFSQCFIYSVHCAIGFRGKLSGQRTIHYKFDSDFKFYHCNNNH